MCWSSSLNSPLDYLSLASYGFPILTCTSPRDPLHIIVTQLSYSLWLITRFSIDEGNVTSPICLRNYLLGQWFCIALPLFLSCYVYGFRYRQLLNVHILMNLLWLNGAWQTVGSRPCEALSSHWNHGHTSNRFPIAIIQIIVFFLVWSRNQQLPKNKGHWFCLF